MLLKFTFSYNSVSNYILSKNNGVSTQINIKIYNFYDFTNISSELPSNDSINCSLVTWIFDWCLYIEWRNKRNRHIWNNTKFVFRYLI